MLEIFLPIGQSWFTPRSKNILNQPKPLRKSSKRQNGLSYLGPKIWNNLHSDLKSAESVYSFKHKPVCRAWQLHAQENLQQIDMHSKIYDLHACFVCIYGQYMYLKQLGAPKEPDVHAVHPPFYTLHARDLVKFCHALHTGT